MATRNKASNTAQNAKGKVKETVGSATGNESLRKKGKSDQGKSSFKNAGENLKSAASNLRSRSGNR